MEKLFNKNGIVVRNNLKAIQEELLRGTGFVMGGGGFRIYAKGKSS